MKKLIIRFDKNKCVGNGGCVAAAPDFFKLEEDKSVCIGAKVDKKTNIYTLIIPCDDDTAKQIVAAGESCPVNAIGVYDADTKREIVSTSVDTLNTKEIFATYDDAKEFVLDKEGYFLIRLDKGRKLIEVAFCNEKNKIVLTVRGKKPIDIYHTILNKEKLPIRKEHAAYLGRELQKAYIALENGLNYVQDDELVLTKLNK